MTTTPLRRAPIALWRIAETFLQTLQWLFGEPKHVARESVVGALAYKQLASWLACAEAMMRRLLLIEAAAIPKPDTRQRARAKRPRLRKLCEFWPDKPEDWRVHFRCFGAPASSRHFGEPTHRGGKLERRLPAGSRRSKQFRDAWPLALRYEALLRVFENPEPYARRLSHRLHKRPLRSSALFRAPPEAQHRIDGFDTITASATQARDRMCDSS